MAAVCGVLPLPARWWYFTHHCTPTYLPIPIANRHFHCVFRRFYSFCDRPRPASFRITLSLMKNLNGVAQRCRFFYFVCAFFFGIILFIFINVWNKRMCSGGGPQMNVFYGAVFAWKTDYIKRWRLEFWRLALNRAMWRLVKVLNECNCDLLHVMVLYVCLPIFLDTFKCRLRLTDKQTSWRSLYWAYLSVCKIVFRLNFEFCMPSHIGALLKVFIFIQLKTPFSWKVG